MASVSQALLNGNESSAPAFELRAGDLAFDLKTLRATRAGVEIKLSLNELRLLNCLLRHKGSTVTREQIWTEVWGQPVETSVSTNARSNIGVHIKFLRNKIDRSNPVRLVKTVHKGIGLEAGYKIQEPQI